MIVVLLTVIILIGYTGLCLSKVIPLFEKKCRVVIHSRCISQHSVEGWFGMKAEWEEFFLSYRGSNVYEEEVRDLPSEME